jgi:hypothetical protein
VKLIQKVVNSTGLVIPFSFEAPFRMTGATSAALVRLAGALRTRRAWRRIQANQHDSAVHVVKSYCMNVTYGSTCRNVRCPASVTASEFKPRDILPVPVRVIYVGKGNSKAAEDMTSTRWTVYHGHLFAASHNALHCTAFTPPIGLHSNTWRPSHTHTALEQARHGWNGTACVQMFQPAGAPSMRPPCVSPLLCLNTFDISSIVKKQTVNRLWHWSLQASGKRKCSSMHAWSS